jgi:hypothetical protein
MNLNTHANQNTQRSRARGINGILKRKINDMQAKAWRQSGV